MAAKKEHKLVYFIHVPLYLSALQYRNKCVVQQQQKVWKGFCRFKKNKSNQWRKADKEHFIPLGFMTVYC